MRLERLRTSYQQHPRIWQGVGLAVVILLILHECSGGSSHKKQTKNVQSVVLAKAKTEDMPVYLYGLGTVTPGVAITVRTQINGQLLSLNFTEGQNVKKGAILAEIDPRPYEAQLIQYQGQLIRDQALLDNAKVDLERYQQLWKEDATSQQILATQASLVKQYEGDVEIDKGLIQATKLNLKYCKIAAPVNGRVGLNQVDPGNYVQVSDTNGIVVLNTEDVISIVFTLPESDVDKVVDKVQKKQKLVVEAYDREQTKRLGTSSILYLDNQINTSTGTLSLKSDFKNSSRTFFNNQFVNVHLLIDTLKNATVVPTAALQYGTKGTFVYAVDDKQLAHVKPVTVGVTVAELASISEGLIPGESVVIEGADKLVEGTEVTTQDVSAESQSKSPSAHKSKSK